MNASTSLPSSSSSLWNPHTYDLLVLSVVAWQAHTVSMPRLLFLSLFLPSRSPALSVCVCVCLNRVDGEPV